MAMSKTERERMEALEHEARMARALRFPTDPCPVPMTKEEILQERTVTVPTMHYRGTEEVAVGWFANSHAGHVTKGCSNGTNRNRDANGMGTCTQGMGQMYRTEVDAYRALRHEMVRMVAANLAAIDKAVEEAEKRAATEV